MSDPQSVASVSRRLRFQEKAKGSQAIW